jgi:hypothetical protein
MCRTFRINNSHLQQIQSYMSIYRLNKEKIPRLWDMFLHTETMKKVYMPSMSGTATF